MTARRRRREHRQLHRHLRPLLLAFALHGAVAHSESAEQHRAQAALGPAAHALGGAGPNHNDVVARRALAHDMHVDHLRAQDARHAKTLKYGNNHATRGAHDNARGVGAGRWGGYLASPAGARGTAIRGQPDTWRVIQASLLANGKGGSTAAAARGGRNAQPDRPVPPAELQAAHRQLFGADLQHPLLGHARAASSPLPIVTSLARAVDRAMDWGGGSFGDGALEEVELAGYMNRAARLRILLHLQATVSAHTQRRAADDVAHIAALKAGGLALSDAEHLCQHRDPLLPGPVPRAFAFADVDNNGLLSVEEYLLFDFGMTSKQLRDEQGFEDAEGWVGAVAEMATAGARMVMEAVDEDGDGRLTQEEMLARYEHFGLPAGARGSGARSNAVVHGEL